MARFRRRRVRRRRRRMRRMPRRRFSRRRRMVVDPERKLVVQSNPGGTPISLNFDGFSQLLNGAPQGVDQISRQGFQSYTVSCMISYEITSRPAPGTGPSPQVVKVALIHYKQPDGILIQLGDIWDSMGTIFSVIGHRNLLHAFRYKVLWSRVHRIVQFDQANLIRTVHRRLRIRTRYLNADATFASITSGALYLVAFSDTNVTVAEPFFKFVSRVRFVG